MNALLRLLPGADDAKPRLGLLLAYAVAAVVGARYGFEFGVKLWGAPMGVLMGANAAVFGWLMVGAAADLLLRFRRS